MKVTTLNRNDFEEQCKQLFSKIDFEPDLVVGIVKGGEFVLEEFKKTNKGEGVIYAEISPDLPKKLKKIIPSSFK